jgi:cytochrome c-type biogenesis protein CcsB
MKNWLLLAILLLGWNSFASLGDLLGTMPVQENGRLKPFDTFARESLQLIYGKSHYQDRDPNEILFTWMIIPEHWIDTDIVEVRHAGLKEALKIDKEVKYLSPRKLFTNERLPLIFQELQNLLNQKEKLNPYYSAVQRLESQLGLFQAIQSGKALRVVPRSDSDTWMSINELDGPLRDSFVLMTKTFVEAVAKAKDGKEIPLTPDFRQAFETFQNQARANGPANFSDPQRIKIEVFFNHFRPFLWAWIAYLIGVLTLIIYMVSGREWASVTSWIFLPTGFFLHALGLAMRVYLAGRPPVSNMYETVVWVPLGVMFFGFILGHLQKNRLLLACSASVAIFCLILTDLSPTVLDGSIQPLEPVLRSTFWLSTHVLIITISYAAFFLAFAIGDLTLFYYLKNEKHFVKQIDQGVRSIYRSIQIGVVLLAFGIILGGIWADYSWGRFWGWDPKETWALIALLGYIALLHGRLVGWVRNFELAAGAVVAFSLVIMSWYGVNFLLGAGLHTYGFGAGGVEYVLTFVVLQLSYVAYVTTVRYGRLKQKS